MNNKFTCRVYYEDTDAGGVVYHANYLKYAERARTELLRSADINLSEQEFLFVVRSASLDLKKPAKHDDEISIETNIVALSAASMEMEQLIKREDQLLSIVNTKIACVDKSFKPTRIPEHIKQKLV